MEVKKQEIGDEMMTKREKMATKWRKNGEKTTTKMAKKWR